MSLNDVVKGLKGVMYASVLGAAALSSGCTLYIRPIDRSPYVCHEKTWQEHTAETQLRVEMLRKPQEKCRIYHVLPQYARKR